MSVADIPKTDGEPQPLRPLSRLQQAAVALGTVSMGAGLSINVVVVAPLARDAGLTELQVAGIMALSTLLFTLTIPWWGKMADRFGRKRIMVFSLLMMAICNAAFIFALDAALAGIVTGTAAFALLCFARFWFGLLSPGLQPASMAAMADATTPATRAAGMGLLGAGMSIGSIIGPASAAVLARIDALLPIWAAVVFAVLVAGVIAFILPPTRPARAGAKRPPPLSIRDPRIIPPFVFLLVYFTIVGGVQQTIAWLIKDRFLLDRADAVEAAGVVMAALGIMLIIVQFGYLGRAKPDPRKMLPQGLFLIAVGYAITLGAMQFWLFCLGFGVVGIGAGLCVPALNALGTLAVEPQEQGSAASLMSAAPPGGYILGPLAGAGLYMLNPALPLLISTIAIVGLLAYSLLGRLGRRKSAPAE
ncbi:MAG: MFS transporter [Pseudomonadota bacterium]